MKRRILVSLKKASIFIAPILSSIATRFSTLSTPLKRIGIFVVPVITLIMLVSVLAACAVSEQVWSNIEYTKPEGEYEIRRIVGLPSITAGGNYKATRNPLLELFCTPLYDMPNGHDYIYPATGYINTPLRDPEYFKTVPEFNMTAVRVEK